MYRSFSFRAVVCLSALLPATFSQAATDTDVETLKQELLELKQRYDVQQKALMVLEQRVRQVEVEPRVFGGDGAAVDQLRHQVAQQVGGGVKAHQPVAARPVHAGGHGIALLQF